MPERRDIRTPRLYTEGNFQAGQNIDLTVAQAHYLINVMRLGEGDSVLVFNGQQGEWRAVLSKTTKKHTSLTIQEQTRPQTQPTNLIYAFAPLKQARLDYMVQKAVEMGVGHIQPVLTQHTQMRKINEQRLQANIIEAAEQCGVLSVPDLKELVSLEEWAQANSHLRILFFDEADAHHNPLPMLYSIKRTEPLAILIGPEGGFSTKERDFLCHLAHVTALPLGQRILRADTAAVAALALVQATLGDWE